MRVLDNWLAFSVVALAGLVTCGCESSYGVVHSARLSQFPDPVCVRTVLEEVSGIREYDEFHWPKDLEQDTTQQGRRHTFSYTGTRAQVILVLQDRRGKVRLYQTDVAVRPLSQEEVDEARRLMSAVEAGLAAKCGISELIDGVREVCHRVECP